jgi:hypothetical protein
MKKKKIAENYPHKSPEELKDPFRAHSSVLSPKNSCYPDNRKWGMQVSAKKVDFPIKPD